MNDRRKDNFPSARRGTYYIDQTVMRSYVRAANPIRPTKKLSSNQCNRELGLTCRCVNHQKKSNELLYQEVEIRKFPIFGRFWSMK